MSGTTTHTYTLDLLSSSSGVSTQTIVQYQQQGILPTQLDDDTLRALRRLEALRETCGMNLSGLKLFSQLLDEVEHLRHELRARR